ncbi:hypothetical protein C1752_01203 [Acaryochloris thomasi RCC1774]|uniref:Uncharacterized protein n=1 Tax=Acaryochloris thomasi RCC1774 TaxID=1764569 RepID=A0A2W1K306_9CYAN|nr:hypothetical protein [Acaryochloris thomasi]PZD74387.1 hypothetical protein C1752_01203 [Acaryochloris thomasi RCC1774]
MGVNIKKWSGAIVLAALVSSAGSAALAQEQEAELPPLRESSIPETVFQNSSFNSVWKDLSIVGDTKFLFGVDYDDARIAKDARRIETLYDELLEQQDRDNPTIRTRDLPNPYDTSVFELQGL